MRILICLPFLFLSPAALSQQDSQFEWFDIPNDVAALAILWGDQGQPFTVSVVDASGASLAASSLISGPFVTQYRLEPGTYQVFVGEWSTELDLRPGEISFLSVAYERDPSPFMGKADATASALVSGELEAAQPADLVPDGSLIYFNTEPPWELPPRPRTD